MKKKYIKNKNNVMTAASQSAFLCAAVNMLLVWPKSPALKPA